MNIELKNVSQEDFEYKVNLPINKEKSDLIDRFTEAYKTINGKVAFRQQTVFLMLEEGVKGFKSIVEAMEQQVRDMPPPPPRRRRGRPSKGEQ